MKALGFFVKFFLVFCWGIWASQFSVPETSKQQEFTYSNVKTADNITVSVARYCGVGLHHESPKKMIILPGKTCNDAWKKFIALKFVSHGFDVFVLDFRGQGRSQRLVPNPQMIHVDNFNDYLLDLEALVSSKPIKGMPIYLYGHSMGGLVALLALKKSKINCTAAILEAPMIGINTSPVPSFLAHPLAWFTVKVLKKAKDYCITQSDYNAKKNVFSDNKCSHSEELYNQFIHLQERDKTMVPRGPSWGWIFASFRAIREFLKDLKPQYTLKTKIFIGTAGDDRVVDTAHNEKVALSFHAIHKVYAGAWHSLQHDSKITREAFFNDIAEFLNNLDRFAKNTS